MRKTTKPMLPVLAALAVCFSAGVLAQNVDESSAVSVSRIEKASNEPQNWLTYGGGYDNQRHSKLSQITPANIKNLKLQWVLQSTAIGYWENNPLVVNGIMYVTQRPNDIVALDARTGKVFWVYKYTNAANARVCCGANNRGLAILGHTLFMGTLDSHIVAVDARSGLLLWNVAVADPKDGFGMSGAPIIVKDKVVSGVSGGDGGAPGFVVALDSATGKEVWRFNSIPKPGEPGSETWPKNDSWKRGGGATWAPGAYDPKLNMVYWGVGNPSPNYNNINRPGDNLYTDSAVALDADTGKLKWHFQFTPNDQYDYDSTEVPVLADINWKGKPTKAMFWANRNGFFYVLDRTNGKFLLGKNFVPVNWTSGLDADGRPVQTPQPHGSPTYPGVNGGTNWYPTSYSPKTGLVYVPIWENYGSYYRVDPNGNGGFAVVAPTPGAATPHMGVPGLRIDTATDETGHASVIAIDPKTGNRAWSYKLFDVSDAGMLSTASGLVFSGSREGYFYALDATNGKNLWQVNLGAMIAMAPMTYQIAGKQYVAVISGQSLSTFAVN